MLPENSSITREQINALGERVVGALIEVHRNLGPGLLESIYELALCHELSLRDIPFQKQADIALYPRDDANEIAPHNFNHGEHGGTEDAQRCNSIALSSCPPCSPWLK
jgi:hypothetical protein